LSSLNDSDGKTGRARVGVETGAGRRDCNSLRSVLAFESAMGVGVDVTEFSGDSDEMSDGDDQMSYNCFIGPGQAILLSIRSPVIGL
jgi:hypothetical protein